MKNIIVLEGKGYTPDGQVRPMTQAEAETLNAQADAVEVDYIKTHPDRICAYVKTDGVQQVNGMYVNPVILTTWNGTEIGKAFTGSRYYMRFGRGSYRRSVDAQVFGVRYTGTWCESAQDLVRLRKAKRQ